MKMSSLDILTSFVIAMKNEQKTIDSKNGCDFEISTNSRYLLGQLIRQLWMPQNHYYVSEKAFKLWNQITDQSQSNFYHREKVTCFHDNISVWKYKGSSTEHSEDTLNKGDEFIYRDVFHEEHIVPIKVIIDDLLLLSEPNPKTIKEVLEKELFVCRRLKREDRSMHNKYRRFKNVEEHIPAIVINGIYKDHGIFVKGWDYSV